MYNLSKTKYVVVDVINTSKYIPAQQFFLKTQKLISNIIHCKFIVSSRLYYDEFTVYVQRVGVMTCATVIIGCVHSIYFVHNK